MNENTHMGLLPAGLADILPPDAELEAHITEVLMASFSQYGYERVKPPLIEFEDVLLSGSGAKMAKQTFRLMDPISQRMLGLRADMTLQIARIASTRLKDIPRPIRLSYAGQVLRVKGSSQRPKRQFGQIGVELIGSFSPKADSEIILMAAEALSNLGIANLSVDLCLPTLVPAICENLKIDSNIKVNKLLAALDHKDVPTIEILEKELGKNVKNIFSSLVKAVGPVDLAIETLKKIDLPREAAAELKKLSDIIISLQERTPNLTITVDPVETRGYEYHTGVTFTFFALDVRGEIGRGGRYLVNDTNGIEAPETATGASLYIDTIQRALPRPKKRNRVLIAASNTNAAIKLRKEGWITVEHFEDNSSDNLRYAKKTGCTHFWDGKNVIPIKRS
ncbi:MAG: ATP phosphoribosyltransferase regulatory subunit [Pseudomonadota bacterium]|nr:ATP phosphoribosyltransferase regulatory subunit [Pseudomonadota bacterium]